MKKAHIICAHFMWLYFFFYYCSVTVEDLIAESLDSLRACTTSMYISEWWLSPFLICAGYGFFLQILTHILKKLVKLTESLSRLVFLPGEGSGTEVLTVTPVLVLMFLCSLFMLSVRMAQKEKLELYSQNEQPFWKSTVTCLRRWVLKSLQKCT